MFDLQTIVNMRTLEILFNDGFNYQLLSQRHMGKLNIIQHNTI